jgi:hypothetical protein
MFKQHVDSMTVNKVKDIFAQQEKAAFYLTPNQMQAGARSLLKASKADDENPNIKVAMAKTGSANLSPSPGRSPKKKKDVVDLA